MNGLPQGWASASIGELIELNPKNESGDDVVAGFVPMPLMATNYLDPVRYEKRLWRDAKKGYTQFADGDVLLAKITPCFENGKAGIPADLPNGIGAGSTEYFVCRPKDGLLIAKYLLAHFKTRDFLLEGQKNMTGSVGHKRVPKSFLLEREILVAPLSEQTRIADKLDALLARVDAARERLGRVPALFKRFRQSVLAAAASGELSEEWRGGTEAKNWELVALKEVAADFSYGSAAKSAKEGKVPVLRMGNIQNGLLDWEGLVFTSDKAEIAKYKLSTGDVLFNRTNSPELVGKTAVFRCDREAVYAGYLIRVRCSEKLLPDFLSFCLNGPIGLHWRWEVKTDGVSQSNINATKLAAFEIKLPPIDEQREIVRRVEALFALAEKVEAQYEIARARVDKLTPSLLAKAFRGELVPQDPSDEPAAMLLERLQASKANTPKPVKQGRKSSATVRKARKAS